MTITPELLAELKARAEAAIARAPGTHINPADPPSVEWLQYVLAANPATILELVGEIERLRAAIRKSLEDYELFDGNAHMRMSWDLERAIGADPSTWLEDRLREARREAYERAISVVVGAMHREAIYDDLDAGRPCSCSDCKTLQPVKAAIRALGDS